ncbi:glycoside hydrolase family 16 protein [Mycobacterium sp. C31M]
MADDAKNTAGYRFWLGASVMAAGLGAAVASGQGLATAAADEGAGSGSASSEASSAGDAGPSAATSPTTARTAGDRGLRSPRTAMRARTAATAPRPLVRLDATTQRDTSTAVEPGDGDPRTVTVEVADVEIDTTPTDTKQTDTADGLIIDAVSEQPYDRRRADHDTRPARADRDSSRADAGEAAQPPEQSTTGSAAAEVALTTAAAAPTAAADKPVTFGSLISNFMSRLGFKPFNFNFFTVSLPKMVNNFWRDIRTRLFGAPATPVVVPPTNPGTPANPGPVTTPPATQEPVLLWETNFSSIEEAMEAWSLQSGRWGAVAGENQYYTPDFSNVTVDANGHLIISVRRGPTPDNAAAPNNYTSARVVSFGKQSVQPNSRIVARMQLPYSKGLLPAFWMVGLEPGHEFDWPRQGEVDIVEYPGFGTEEGKTHWTGNVHGPAADDNTVDVKLHNIGGNLGVDLSQGFHDYGIDWYPDRIVWHIDGVQTGQITQAQYEALGGDWTPFSGAWPHYLILNVAVGHDWTGDPDPRAQFPTQEMKVDWVRVYSLAD